MIKPVNLYGWFCLFLPSCRGDRKQENVVRLVSEWQGKGIVFQKDIVCTFQAFLPDKESKEAVRGSCWWDGEYTFCCVGNGLGCAPCGD